MSYSTYNFPYRASTSSISMTTNTGTYSSRLYDYTYSGGVGTLVPTTSAGSNKVLVFRSGTTYYALRINNTSFSYYTLASVSVQVNGTITTSTNMTGTTAILTATQSGTGITLRSSRGRYLTSTGTTFGRSTSAGTTFYLDSKGTSITHKVQYIPLWLPLHIIHRQQLELPYICMNTTQECILLLQAISLQEKPMLCLFMMNQYII
jgi:hypothetical protein